MRPMRAEEEISFNQCNQTVTDLHKKSQDEELDAIFSQQFMALIVIETNFHGDKTFDMVSIF